MIEANRMFSTASVRLKVIRHALGIKQLTFANYLQVAAKTLRKYENGNYTLSVKLRERLRFVGINAQWLEYGTGHPFEYDIPVVREKILFSLKQNKGGINGK